MSPWSAPFRAVACVLAVTAPAYSPALAQQTLAQAHHTSWGEDQGLPSAAMDRVVRSGDGYLWLGGEGPLVRFDGVRFTTFDGTNTPALASTVGAGLRPRLVDRDGTMWISRPDGALVQYRDGRFRVAARVRSRGYVSSMAQDGTGRLWAVVSSNGGPHFVDGDSLVSAPLPAWLPRGDVLSVLADRGDGVWLGVRRLGLVHLTPRGAETFRDPSAVAGSVPRALVQARDGAVWVFHDGLRVLRDGRWTGLTLPGTGEPFIPTAATESADGAVWVATRGHGVLRFSGGRVEQYTERDGLSDAVAMALDHDEEGNLWVVTEAGLDRLRHAPFASLGPQQGLPFDSPLWILPDAGGALWALSYVGFRMYRLDGGLVRGEPGRVSATALPDHRYLVLGSARVGGLWLYDPDNLRVLRATPERLIPALRTPDGQGLVGFENRRGDLWVTSSRQPLGRRPAGGRRLTEVTAAVDSIVEIMEDAGGRMLLLPSARPEVLAVQGGRLVRWLGPGQGIERPLRNLVADGGDTLWAHDSDSTLYRIIGTHVSRLVSAGLAPLFHSRSTALLPAGDRVFFASSSGIASVSRAALHAAADHRTPFPALRWYTALDGAPRARLTVLNYFPAFRAADGRLWFSTPGGLLVYDARGDLRNPVAPRVHIEEVRAVDRVLALDSTVAIPPGAERVEFRFTATALRVPERARLEFRLDGVDAGWRTADASRRVTYTQLRPRRYRFRVRAWNEDGVPAASEAVLPLRVLPLWSESWWFRSLQMLAAAAAIAGAVALVLRARVRRSQERLAAGYEATLAERTRLAGELHDTLLQAFTGVTLRLQALRGRMIAAPDEVERDLGQVLGVADVALREARSAVWDMRAPELDGRDVAAALEDSLRDAHASHLLAAGASVEVEVTVTGRRRRVAPAAEIAVQRIGLEAMTNALRHAGARCIRVTIAFEPRHLCLEVRDDGVGFDVAQSRAVHGQGHWGLVGMRERARRAGGTLDLTSAPGAGTAIVVRLPVDDA